MTIYKSNLIDISKKEIYGVHISIENKIIKSITRVNEEFNTFILPGFVDAHIHIESSMLVPKEFARIAVTHGTVATVSDPHEIGNVLGVEGVKYMINNGKEVNFNFYFGAPSCVPATNFETSGAVINSEQIEELMALDEIKYLAEMMNFPGVLFKDVEVIKKLKAAQKYNKPIDGHAPGLKGKQAKDYVDAGISTDHECYSLDEALEKISYGMKILIREGSAAKNFNALHPLIELHPEMVMFCSDDKHPDDLVEGHINLLVKRALKLGYNLFDVLQIACLNPIKHYNLEVGTLNEGDFADFIEIDNIENFTVLKTFIKGQIMAQNGKTEISYSPSKHINNFNSKPISINDLKITPVTNNIQVIKAIDGELITEKTTAKATVFDNNVISNVDTDILKMVLINRYEKTNPAFAFIQGFGIKSGAIASCVGHDSHNIVAVGSNDEFICKAINAIIENKGGISVVSNNNELVLPLPIAGIMTDKNAYDVANEYHKLDKHSKEIGSTLRAPFMTLSFMALLVIPSLKLSDKGLFDGDKFEFTPLFIN